MAINSLPPNAGSQVPWPPNTGPQNGAHRVLATATKWQKRWVGERSLESFRRGNIGLSQGISGNLPISELVKPHYAREARTLK